MTQYDVVALGNAIVDVLAQVEDHFLTQHHSTKGSMTLIDQAKMDKIYTTLPPAKEISGGSAANTVAGIAGLGGKPAFIGKVKNDQLGKIFTHDLQAMGVEYHTNASKDGPSTACCIVAVTPDAERTMMTYLGATKTIEEKDIDKTLIESSKLLYLEGYLWDEPHAKAAMRKAMSYAKLAGKKVALSLSDPFCVERHRRDFLHLLEHDIDILFGNEEEIKSLTQCSNLKDAVKKLNKNCEIIAITLSSKGSKTFHQGKEINTPAYPIDELVDTTGAGDLFASGFLYGYTQGYSIEACAQVANLMASEIISHMGARPEADLKKMLQSAQIAA